MLRLTQMLRWFDSPAHLAAFLGVTPNNLWRWTTGRTQPDAAALRLLAVMERIETTEVFAVLVEQARPAPKPPRAPRKRRVRGVNVSTVAPMVRVVPVNPETGS